ncbi:MAG: co-chaperone GroES [Candidatus Riflebacteria bacterium RBG_13_59_9]|nr:MAG: co-chaperone GroES [Candidatus Riflebacteria bacterium RBG_13_59_9]
MAKKFVYVPAPGRVIVRPLEEGEQRTTGGIVIPDSAKERPSLGEVVAVGEGRLLDNGQRAKVFVEPGMKVLYGKYSGNEFKFGGQEYLILRDDDIMAWQK